MSARRRGATWNTVPLGARRRTFTEQRAGGRTWRHAAGTFNGEPGRRSRADGGRTNRGRAEGPDSIRASRLAAAAAHPYGRGRLRRAGPCSDERSSDDWSCAPMGGPVMGGRATITVATKNTEESRRVVTAAPATL